MRYDFAHYGPKQRIREECIRCNRWAWAKAMSSIPHEHIVRNGCPLSNEDFTNLVTLQRNHGIFMRCGMCKLPYFHIDGYKCWTMGNFIDGTTILNLKKFFNEYNAIANGYDTILEEDSFQAEYEEVGNRLNSLIKGSVFKIRNVTGRRLEQIEIEPSFYTSTDPSNQMAAMFYRKFTNFSRPNSLQFLNRRIFVIIFFLAK